MPQRLLEVELAAHGCLGHGGDLVRAPGVLGEHLDHLALDERGVDVHDDETLRVPQDAALLDREVHLVLERGDREVGLQEVGVGTRHLHPQSGDRVAGEPQDTVDVAAGVLDPRGDRGHGGRRQRVAEDGDLAASDPTGAVVAGAVLDLDLEPELLAHGSHGLLERFGPLRPCRQHAEHQASPHDELLDVDDLQRVTGELVEQPGGDAAAVRAGEGHQHGRGGQVQRGHVLGHRA